MPTQLPKFEIVIIGSLANFDIIIAETLSRLGFACVVVRVDNTAIGDIPLNLIHFSEGRILLFQGHRWLYQLCRRSKCVVTISGVLPWALKWTWLLAQVFRFPPIVNYCTGSDITELVRERSLNGFIYRSLVRRAALNVLAGAPKILHTALDFKITNSIFVRSPYMLSKEDAGYCGPETGPIVYLHASNLDWAQTDAGDARNSTKGNDRFIRAFIRALDAGCDVKCIILDRGPDRAEARRLVERSGKSDAFEWLPSQSPKAFADLTSRADVVVDQFDVGCLGGIATEAMSRGKSVMGYLDASSVSIFYDVLPPFLNCRSEEDIFDMIVSNQDRQALCRLGAAAERWVRINHGINSDFRELTFRIAMLTGTTWPRDEVVL